MCVLPIDEFYSERHIGHHYFTADNAAMSTTVYFLLVSCDTPAIEQMDNYMNY
jgi:hypothetical protein